MASVSRRTALETIMGVAVMAGTAPGRAVGQGESAAAEEAARWVAERARVMQLGFTADEAECWEHIARAAAKFFELPVLSELDAHEIAEATHVFQNKLLSRPVYRRYVELTRQQNSEQSPE